MVWAVPCSPHVRTMWKNLGCFINYLTTVHMKVVRALRSHAHTFTHLQVQRRAYSYIHTLIEAYVIYTHTDDRTQTYITLTPTVHKIKKRKHTHIHTHWPHLIMQSVSCGGPSSGGGRPHACYEYE